MVLLPVVEEEDSRNLKVIWIEYKSIALQLMQDYSQNMFTGSWKEAHVGCHLWRTAGDGESFEAGSSALCSAEALSAGLSCFQNVCWGCIHIMIQVNNIGA